MTADETVYLVFTALSTEASININRLVSSESTESMVSMAEGTVNSVPTDEDASGPYASADTTSVTVNAFKISSCEVTYALWYKVYTWATNRTSDVYSFTNAGTEGNDGTAGDAPTEAAQYEPVTNVSWRDCIVWCNAYSEYYGLVPVYYTDYTSSILRSADSNADICNINSDADGYRLPTEAEWEYAARGGDPTATTNWNYTYAGSNTIDDVAWYTTNSSSSIHEVATKDANTADLYDMSGNVQEWCYGVDSVTPSPIIRGGSYDKADTACTVSTRISTYATTENDAYTGFRVCTAVEIITPW